ncbi:MAG: hypothetical protein VX933_05555, partial [Bacteroidota bacterium]|nr:hypothetical protein [Bacteroidota bacterium]
TIGDLFCLVNLHVYYTYVFSKWLLTSFNHKGNTVLVAPASGFYGERNLGKSLIRIAFVLDIERLKESVIILEKALVSYPHTLILKENP